MVQDAFIRLVADIAVKDWRERRIMLPSVVIAQACKESAFGRSELAENAKALFGIKKNGWTGKTYRKKAEEQNPDGSIRTDEDTLWRAYDSWEESILDHNTYIAERKIGNQTEPNFSEVIGETNVKKVLAGLVGNGNRESVADMCTDPELRSFVIKGKTAYGYATGLGYPQSLLYDYILKYNLIQYDILAVDKNEEVNTMAKKVFIGVGHGGSDPGAVKYLVEKEANLVSAIACKDLLESYGVIVKMSRTGDENDTLTEEINECNAFDPDVAIDIHNNAGGGDGFEAYVTIHGGLGPVMGKNIEAEVIKLGQNSRGVKTRKNSNGLDYYGFVRLTRCPAVIVEGVFVDNATDYKIMDTVAEQRAFGEAYARGILKTLGITEKPNATVNNTLYRVQVGAFANKDNAERLKKELDYLGYSAIIVTSV